MLFRRMAACGCEVRTEYQNAGLGASSLRWAITAREFLPDLYPICFNPSSPPKARRAPDWACGSPEKSYKSTALRSGSAAALAMQTMAHASAFSFRQTLEKCLAADFADER